MKRLTIIIAVSVAAIFLIILLPTPPAVSTQGMKAYW